MHLFSYLRRLLVFPVCVIIMTALSSQVGNLVLIDAFNAFSRVLSIVFPLRASCCFPAEKNTRSIPPPGDAGQPWLCARSWLARHPAKIEITGSSGGSSHHTKIFFFCKNHDFSRFLINFSTVVVVKHTHAVDLKRLTHIHSHRDLNSLSLSTESTYLLVPMP